MRCFKNCMILVCVSLLVVGCSNVREKVRENVRKLDKSNEYQKAQVYDKDIVLPGDVDSSTMENYYPIPAVKNGANHASTLPPGSNIK